MDPHHIPKSGSQRCSQRMRQPLSRPSGLHSIPGTRRHKAGGSVFGPLARASCKPHPGSPGATDPPRPALFSPQPGAFVSHALTRLHTHPRRPRAHAFSPGSDPQEARALAAHTQRSGGGGGRKELICYRPTDCLGWGKGRRGPRI